MQRSVITRREALRRGVALAAVFYGAQRLAGTISGGGVAQAAEPFTTALPVMPEMRDAHIVLTAAENDVQILPGAATRMWTFNGSFPGPLIRRPSGQPTRVTLRHELPAAGSLTLHHHGAHSASHHDGQPRPDVAVQPGESRTYIYESMDDAEPERAALQWYHDHTHFRTGRNVWRGLAGLVILEDDFEAALPLPRGEHELPLVVCDRAFDARNQLVDPFPPGEPEGGIATWDPEQPPFNEVVGDRVLVNGAPQPYTDVAARRYRLRLLNASNFQTYNLRLTAGELVLIGNEAGLLPRPVRQASYLVGPGERLDLVAGFAGLSGERPVLESVDVPGGGSIVSEAHVGPILQFRVGQPVPDDSAIPDSLRPLPAWVSGLALAPERVWTFGGGPDMANEQPAWTINGQPYDHARVDARPELGATETWLLANTTSVNMSHYIHIHDVDWKVLSRNGAPPAPGEDALKETFRLDPGEVIVIGSKFTDHTGLYMLHCHMLEHEDNGMMATFDVAEPGRGDGGADRGAGDLVTATINGVEVPVPVAGLSAGERACLTSMLKQMSARPGRHAPVRRSAAAAAPALLCRP